MGAAMVMDHAALPWRDVPRRRGPDHGILQGRVGCDHDPHHDPGRAVAGTPLSAPFLAKLATEVANVSYFKIETAGAATKLRELLALGGPAIEGLGMARRRSR